MQSEQPIELSGVADTQPWTYDGVEVLQDSVDSVHLSQRDLSIRQFGNQCNHLDRRLGLGRQGMNYK